MNNYYRYDMQIARYLEHREDIEAVFTDDNLSSEPPKRIMLGEDKYQLDISLYNTKQGCWPYTRGVVRGRDGEVIADVKRNYSDFWHCYVEGHPKGNDYLICGEDYQGQTVVNLTTKDVITNFPDDGYDGIGFCWTYAAVSPDKRTLAVYGCYWACPFEIVLFDFTDPDLLPYREIGRYSEMFYDFKGWKDDDTLLLTRDVDYRKSDGKKFDELTEEEWKDVTDDDIVEEIFEVSVRSEFNFNTGNEDI